MLRQTLLWASTNPWLERQFRRRYFAQKAVSRFMPGESSDEALEAAKKLQASGIATIVTCLGENVSARDDVSSVTDHYTQVLNNVAARGLDCHISVKPTHLGLDIDPEWATEHISALAAAAARHHNFLWIDMESSPYVDPTLRLYEAVRARHTNVGLCLQAYLFRTQDDLKHLLNLGGTVRIVKGAYREPNTVAMAHKPDVDQNFLDLARMLISDRRIPEHTPHAIATHDVSLAEQIFREGGTQTGKLELNMLYGIATGSQREFSAQGVPTRVLISYGEAWYAWYMRRLAERPANLGFVLKSMIRR